MEDFELNVYEDVIAADYVNTTSFKEFCEDLDALDSIFADNDFFAEEVVDPNLSTKRKFGKAMKNTSDTISNTLSIYGRTTDVGGGIIKALWDLTFNAINLISKIVLWFLEKINNIPIMITNLIKRIGMIPDNIKAKIQGNVKLHIRVKDIEMLYNESVIRKIDDFISLMKVFRQGDTWTTFFKRRGSIKTKMNKGKEKIDIQETLKHPMDNDMKIGRKMAALYRDLSQINFMETVINLKDKKTVEMYFSNKYKIKFTDLQGNSHEATYYESIKQLVNDLKSRSKELKELRSDIGDKFNAAEAQQQFARLNKMQQERITESIKMISKVVSIVGHLTKCVVEDMSTLNKAVDKCLKRKKIDGDEDPRNSDGDDEKKKKK